MTPRLYKHRKTRQIHAMVLCDVDGTTGTPPTEVVTIETNLLKPSETHSWLGSYPDFEKEFEPIREKV